MDGQKGLGTRPYCPGMGSKLGHVGLGCRLRRCTSFSDDDDWMDGRRSRHTDDTDVLLV